MRLRTSALLERLRTSLFFVPMLAVAGAIGFGLLGLTIDDHLGEQRSLPLGLTSTVESARAVLSTIAGATITFAAIAFSISLLIIQQASSQYSPRVVHTLFQDPYNRRVMGLVVGTFTYCIVVLRSVRSALDEAGEPVIPNLSVAIAVILGIATILATVAFINHSAHSMDISKILEDVRAHATRQLQATWRDPGEGGDENPPPERPDTPAEARWTARLDRSGWIQELDTELMLGALPPRATAIVATVPGRYGIEGATLCTLSVAPDDPAATIEALSRALTIGATRTAQQDVSYGIRQLADVAVKALSPGINDPTTAQDAIFHLAAVLAEALRRDPPPDVRVGDEGRQLVLVEQPTHAELIALGFDEVRRAAAPHPTVVVYLLEALASLRDIACSLGVAERTGAIDRQARLVLDGSSRGDHLEADLDLMRGAYERRFGSAA